MNELRSDHPSRRTFLKHSSQAAAVSALAGVSLPQVYAGEDNTIRIALVGCGGRGTGAVGDAFVATGGPVKLYAMADLFGHRLQNSLSRLKKKGDFEARIDVPSDRQFIGFDAYKKAIDSLRPGDVVILTTHAAFRALHFEYAVEKGINVFMEKSFAPDAPALRRLMKASAVSEQKGLKVGVGFMWRHSRARQEVIQRIQDGAIGDLHTQRIYRVHGPVTCPPLPADTNELTFQIQHATNFTWVSSGFFIDYHCHNIDVACWCKGSWPVKAQGMGGRCFESAGNQFDHYTVEYTFADGTKLFVFSRHMKSCWQTYSDYAHGSKGSAVIMTNLSQPTPRIFKSQNMVKEDVLWEYGGNDPSPYHAEWQVLLDAIRENKPHNESRRAGEAQVAALMGRIATHSGQYITWDQVMESDFQFVDNIDAMTFDTAAPVHPGPDGIYPPAIPGMTKEI